MEYQTSRFGTLKVAEEDILDFSEGLLGFDQLHRFFIVDPGDDTLILWLQSCDQPQVAFPILEPNIVKEDYQIQLTRAEMGLLKISSLGEAKIFSILTIPDDISAMTANLKAPVILNTAERLGRQCVLQQNEYAVKHPAFTQLKARLAFTSKKTTRVSGEEPTVINEKKDVPAVNRMKDGKHQPNL